MINVGDILAFNPYGKYEGFRYGIKDGEQCRITAVSEPYHYSGMQEGETCVKVSFEMVDGGEKFDDFGSQWFGVTMMVEECEF